MRRHSLKKLWVVVVLLLVASWHLDAPVAAVLQVDGGAPAPDCEKWNTEEFFQTATLEQVTACLAAGAALAARTEDGHTPLHFAARNNENPAVVEALLAAGADVNARSLDGHTPLHVAAGNENPAVVEALLEAGANLEARDEDGNTPLHLAANFGEGSRHAGAAIEVLLDAGANEEARNAAGQTPWDLTQENEALKGSDAYWRLNNAPDAEAQRQAARTAIEPEMVVIPAGRFRMGCRECEDKEQPVHEVTVASFELSKYEVTFEEYDRFTAAIARAWADDEGWGRGSRPVINVSWEDAQAYVLWLSAETDEMYRLPSESEWEYAARAGTETAYSWLYWEDGRLGNNRANCRYCGSRWDGEQTAPVGSFGPNAWRLHDILGNVFEWVEDCWHENYAGAPSDGTAWTSGGDCGRRVLRGGSWSYHPGGVHSAFRYSGSTGIRSPSYGFRVARTLTP